MKIKCFCVYISKLTCTVINLALFIDACIKAFHTSFLLAYHCTTEILGCIVLGWCLWYEGYTF